MQFTFFTALATYATVWWTVLFVVLPFGNVTHAEAGIDRGDGGDPAAPVDPKLKKKFITTSWISAIIWFGVWLLFSFVRIPLPALPSGL